MFEGLRSLEGMGKTAFQVDSLAPTSLEFCIREISGSTTKRTRDGWMWYVSCSTRAIREENRQRTCVVV